MSHSEFIDEQPVRGTYEQLLSVDQREEYGASPLMVSANRTMVLRQVTDLSGKEVTDFEIFSKRVGLLWDYTTRIPSANYQPYFGPTGGVILTEYIHGDTVLKRLHGLRDHIGTKEYAVIIKPVNELAISTLVYYREKMAKRDPMVLDVLKSNQWVVGPSATSPKARPRLIDHDAHAILSENEYTLLDEAFVLKFAIAEAATLGIFLSNLSKAPEINQPKIFQPMLTATVDFLEFVTSEDVLSSHHKSTVQRIGEAVANTMDTRTVNNMPMLEISGALEQSGITLAK